MIGGYKLSDVKGKPFSSLLLGTFEDGKLNYAGKVGTGFDAADLTELSRKFKPLERKTSPFVEVPREELKGAVWLEPKLVCQIHYAEWTRDGRLRHPSFQGLRQDKPARDVHRERAEREEDSMAATKTRAGKSGDRRFDGISAHQSRQGAIIPISGSPSSTSRSTTRPSRPHPALRREAADQPGALSGRH